MSITALEIQQVSFGTAKKGYDPAEVDEFLERIAIDVDTLNRAIAEAAARIKAAEERSATAEAKLARAQAAGSAAAVVVPISEPATSAAKQPSVSEDVISKAFIAAQRSADAMQADARKQADSIHREAEAKARDIVREAHAERQKAVSELERLRESTERFRTDYLSLLNHYSADAQKRFPAFEEVIPPSPTAAYQEQKELFAANNASVALAPEPVIASDAGAPQADFAEQAARGFEPSPAPAPEPEPIAVADPFAPSAQAGSFDEFDDEELDIEEID